MAVVAEIIWYKADFMRAIHNNEDFSVLTTCWRLFLCVGLKSNKIFGTVHDVKKVSHLHFPYHSLKRFMLGYLVKNLCTGFIFFTG